MDDTPKDLPPALGDLEREAVGIDFAMGCETRTGSLLATGVGMGAAWLLHGMSLDATLVTVEADPRVLSIARRYLANDPRIDFDNRDADAWLDWYEGPSIDLAFVDCRPGKFTRLDDLLSLMNPGALYVGDDLLPQPTWPSDHQTRVNEFLEGLPSVTRLRTTPMAWSSGLVVGARI
jgi:predicted O-methyltransferase YrrM